MSIAHDGDTDPYTCPRNCECRECTGGPDQDDLPEVAGCECGESDDVSDSDQEAA